MTEYVLDRWTAHLTLHIGRACKVSKTSVLSCFTCALFLLADYAPSCCHCRQRGRSVADFNCQFETIPFISRCIVASWSMFHVPILEHRCSSIKKCKMASLMYINHNDFGYIYLENHRVLWNFKSQANWWRSSFTTSTKPWQNDGEEMLRYSMFRR